MRYALHPGFVTSRNDGERHFIGASQLARLYGLRPGEWFEWSDMRDAYGYEGIFHLYPRYDGNYRRVHGGH